MGEIGTGYISTEPTKYLGDLPEEQRLELGNATKMIANGYETVRRILIGDTDAGKIINTQEIFDIIISYAKNKDIGLIVDQYQLHPEGIKDILKAIGYTDDELSKND